MRKRAVDLIEWILDTGDNRNGIKYDMEIVIV